MDPARFEIDKPLLRRRLRSFLAGLPASERKKRSRKIADRLVRTPAFKKAKAVMIYMALPEEVQTRELIFTALAMKKKVYLPQVNPKTKTITAYRVMNLKKDLQEGSYGILEPKPAKGRRGNPALLDLVVVPGLGFDRKGRRLGRGEGYFDRFLKKAKRAKKIGLAFRGQIVKKVPVDSHDVCVDRVITD